MNRVSRATARVFTWLCLASLPVNLNWADAAAYTTLNEYKAQAQFADNPQTTYTSHNQPNKLAAALNAQQACLQAHPQQSAASGYCELVSMGELAITTTSEIRSRVPEHPHPLFLWRYQSASATVFLGGSIHILKPGLYPLAKQFQQAFDAASHLILEVDLSALSEQQIQAKTAQYGLLDAGQTLPEVLPPATYRALREISGEYGLPLAQLTMFKPALISQQLAVSALVSVGYDPRSGVEAHFVQQAGDKEIGQLETIDEQLDLLLNQPLNVQAQLISDSLAQMENFEEMTARLISAWLSGDDATFLRVFSAQAGASPESVEFMRQLIDQRNAAMTTKIVNMLNTNATYFVLIGAGHYVGEHSIIELLRKRGFRGKRIHSDQDIHKP